MHSQNRVNDSHLSLVSDSEHTGVAIAAQLTAQLQQLVLDLNEKRKLIYDRFINHFLLFYILLADF